MKNMPQGLAVATANGIYMSSKPQRNETYGPGNWKMDLISEEGIILLTRNTLTESFIT